MQFTRSLFKQRSKTLCRDHITCHRFLNVSFHHNGQNLNFSSSGKRNTGKKGEYVLYNLLQQVKEGTITISEAQNLISNHTKNDVMEDPTVKTFANLDLHRVDRTGFPEAVFGSGKTPEQIAKILDTMAGHVNSSMHSNIGNSKSSASRAILATRIEKDVYEKVAAIPFQNGTIQYHETARIIAMTASSLSNPSRAEEKPCSHHHGKIIVACAGTTDLPVAEEAVVTLEASGCNVERIYDVGVAGLHRILNALPKLRHPDVSCIIVVAGMDGALPSVVAGLVSCPVVAVPTSIGYGANLFGFSALLTMLNSCAPGVGVVNIDNGFGGAALAFKCAQRL